MKQIFIRGGIPLKGQVRIQGSKNASLPILAATLMTKGIQEIKNCPKIADVFHMLDLLRSQGVKAHWKGRSLFLDTYHLLPAPMIGKEQESMRASIFLAGAMLSRFGQIDMSYPGGCVIGERPVNWHIYHLHKMGAIFCEDGERLIAKCENLVACDHVLEFPSVGVTENLIMAAVLAKGTTTITNYAREPEIEVLCEFLQAAGAHILVTEAKISIEGVTSLGSASISLPGDRIVAGTYALACVATKGNVLLEGAPVEHMESVIKVLRDLGACVFCSEEGIYLSANERTKAIDCIETAVYPGFPTDLQSPLLAVLATADGKSGIREMIFSNRFRIVEDIKRMGAEVELVDNMALVEGVEYLEGATVRAAELRGGAALVIAGLMAKGVTYIENYGFIYRGYENICRDLTELGARIFGE